MQQSDKVYVKQPHDVFNWQHTTIFLQKKEKLSVTKYNSW
jgi:hypothetical protein